MAESRAASRQTVGAVNTRLANVQGRLGRALETASGPARLAQLQRRAQFARGAAENIAGRGGRAPLLAGQTKLGKANRLAAPGAKGTKRIPGLGNRRFTGARAAGPA